MPEDSLQREDVPAVGEEGPREAMAEDVRRASRRDARCHGHAMDELLDRPRRQATTSSADEERIRIDGTSTRDDQGSQRSPRAAADRDDPLLRALTL
jgi:hypothetical protein